MDASQYHSNGLSNSNSPYSSLPGISPHQLQQSSSLPPHTLPPLQASQNAMQSLYGSAPHTPRTPATPNTPGSANTMGNFPQIGGQSRGYQMMPSNNYQQPPQPYRTSSSMMPQSSTAMSHPQPIAPAPAQSRLPQTLRPMPPNGLQHLGGMPSSYGQNNMMQLQEMEPPTHVVGSQGRRGILPSAPGRPAVTATGTGSTKNAMIPAKDADGKFPCPHCTKTYLHAKHLKRHLLRHTGDRPYMCVLCRDTFSRSDILKRHFQKCSIRRGNPTGASHLSHAQAHLKKSHPGPKASMSNENDLGGVDGMGGEQNPQLFGISIDGSVPDAASHLTDEQAEQLSRSNSLKRLSVGGRDGRMTGPVSTGSNRASFDQAYPGSMPSGTHPSFAFSMPNGQNGHSYSQGYDFASHGNGTNAHPQSTAGQQHGLAWTQMYQSSAHDGFMNNYNPAITNSQVPIKAEPHLNNNANGLFAGIYPSATNGNVAPNFPTWNLQNDSLDEISNRLLYFCFPGNQIIGRGNEIRKYLSADNVQHFLEHFNSFQVHFPVIHFPTFRRSEAYDGLLLAMVCIGAVYSDRLAPSHVREMMEFAKSVIEQNSRVYGQQNIGSGKLDLEEIMAIFMMHVLFTWHGTPVQREKARQQFPMIVELAKRANLTKPSTTSPFSVLHQQNIQVENFNSASFAWTAWVEQEKRSRLLFAIFLLDAAMVVYFNSSPQFDTLEIQLPLPADDASWEARTASECADALGVHGPIAAQNCNPEGSRRMKQPEMHSALKALMHHVYDLQPGTTNLYSKFILVHALHIQLWSAQKQLSQEGQIPQTFPGSGASTPMSQYDWVIRGGGIDPTGSGHTSTNTSGRATPVEGIGQSAQLLKATNNAFDKWKKAWDEDIAVQYPPSSAPSRIGFCRDAVPFYWLAKYMMKNNRGVEWQAAPDQRFTQVMHLLKVVKSWVISDSAQRGEGLGSVSEIDKDYGVTDLTLDMAQLFKAIHKHRGSPASVIRTNISNNGLV